MGKSLRDMTRQEQAAYFKSKDYCGEQLKVVMDAVSYVKCYTKVVTGVANEI